ncbi:MAG: CapA family protein [Candidatus Pacebacteria bacterium]|nr:CapA family protein [Candidatus Paceibacterota bacterium]MCF7857224.1 CapA family protein [Candidatus Paceibacterota bacterium]
MSNRTLYSVVVLSALAVQPVVGKIPHTVYEQALPEVVVSETTKTEKISPTILFVGDIMLGRFVETLTKNKGLMYPFDHVVDLLFSADLTVGNFEGIVSKDHFQTPSGSFRFSIEKENLSHLKDIGFDVVSLANNHSLDFGNEALSYTREYCSDLLLVCVGTPNALDEYSIAFKSLEEKKIGFVFLNTIFQKIDTSHLEEVLEAVATESDVQIVFIHWGDEYQLVHNDDQEALAMLLIDHGVDAVIGHHPHVVQDVGLYKGKPIFYSLGNFVFDQYFSQEVQEGLGVEMTIHDTGLEYRLLPFSSLKSKSQPRISTDEDAKALFKRILSGIKSEFQVNQSEGLINVNIES